MIDGNATFEGQVVAGIATKAYYLDVFVLDPKPSNFSDFGNPQPSLIQTMKNQDKTPSVSFAYNAGVSYSQFHRRSLGMFTNLHAQEYRRLWAV